MNKKAATNRYGVDTAYFEKELKALIKSLPNRPAGELGNYLTKLADVAFASLMKPSDVSKKVKSLIDKKICRSMAEARRVVFSGRYDVLLKKHKDEKVKKKNS